MKIYASTVSGHTSQSEEAKLWVYQSKNHFENARKGKSNRNSADWKTNKRGGKARYQPSFVEGDIFNFVYYDSNYEPRVDDEAILRMNPNSRNSEGWKGVSYFFEWKKEVSDWLMLNSGFMCNNDEVWLSSLTPSKSARKGFGKKFRPVKYTQEYADQDILLWQEAMQELKTQTADRKAAMKKEEDNIARFLSQRENAMLEEKRQAEINKEQAEKVQKATEVRRMLKTLNNEAEADARAGGKGMGKKQRGNKTSQRTGLGEGPRSQGNIHRREDQTIGTNQSSKGGRRGHSSKQVKDKRT
ncbi:hypothetical protein BTUL_0184g00190 [Botrytis tulipae]|uniref:Uncharacterized protein n=1 Tax=Botrytis tulipae TaxID=87230 RepID=A0A4Z1EE83_9HELO|nr:hypothetical protein BTUL_0184g00190 [Botrytis tulipae]